MGAFQARIKQPRFGFSRHPSRALCRRLRASLVEALEKVADPSAIEVLGRWKQTPLPSGRHLCTVEQLFESCLDYLARLLAPWDPYTLYHSRRVARMAGLLAGRVGLSEKDIKAVQVAGFLHDVGKVGIPREVLNRRCRLDAAAYEVVKAHPDIGARILNALPWPWDVLPAVRYHHERWDGSGYPHGLEADEIPLSAQLVGIADFFDSLTTNRPHRAAMSVRHALSTMEAGVGRSFSLDLWRVFEAAVDHLVRLVPPADPVDRCRRLEVSESGAWNRL